MAQNIKTRAKKKGKDSTHMPYAKLSFNPNLYKSVAKEWKDVLFSGEQYTRQATETLRCHHAYLVQKQFIYLNLLYNINCIFPNEIYCA